MVLKEKGKKKEVSLITLAVCIAIGAVIYFIPAPSGLSPEAWHLFAIFVATIVALITKPIPMGAVAIGAITATVLTKTLNLNTALSGFSNSTIWLIVCAFFISRGFIKTGLGERIAYMFVRAFGKKTLGLAYSLEVSDLCLAPAMPSNTARAGGVIYPIVESLSTAFGSSVKDGTQDKMGTFLNLAAFHGDMITSAMFLTAMAANPLAASIASDLLGVELSWGGWLAAAIVPGLISLIVIPLVIYKLSPPEIKETPEAANIAKEHLKEMGPLSRNEKFMIGVFIIILSLWIFGSNIGINATTTAFVGLLILIVTGVLTWDDIKSEKNAWDTLVWFAALVMMANNLNGLGMIPWFSEHVAVAVSSFGWIVALVVIAVAYFYSHYFFASATAHVTAMYGAFVSVVVGVGAPPLLAAYLLAFFSNLYGCLTHYGAGPAPVFYGSGFVQQNKWWGIGFVISLAYLVIWGVAGGAWWKIIGLW